MQVRKYSKFFLPQSTEKTRHACVEANRLEGGREEGRAVGRQTDRQGRREAQREDGREGGSSGGGRGVVWKGGRKVDSENGAGRKGGR